MKIMVAFATAGALTFAGCRDNVEKFSETNLPDFVTRRSDASLHYPQDGFIYRPYIVKSSMNPNMTFLEGVMAERDNENYIFYDPMADGRLLEVSNHVNDGFYHREWRLPDDVKIGVDLAGNGADNAYPLFRRQLCNSN